MLAGSMLAQVAFLPTLHRPFESVILATFAISVIVQNAVRLLFGATPQHVASPWESTVIEVGGVLLFGQRLLVSAVAVAALAALVAFLRLSETGRAMRAMAQNKEACVMVGIDIRRISGSNIVAVADGFDALLSRRPYKAAWPLEDVNGYFRQQGGKQFDPDCVGALFRRLDTIVSVHEDISDRNNEAAS